MTTLVFGASGLLGSIMTMHYNVIGLTRNVCDITDPTAISTIFGQYKPEVVINCAGVVPKAIDSAGVMQTFRTNSLGPKLLKKACNEHGAKLIHISTDYVFSGTFGGYNEESIPNPPDIYGLSKYLGEVTDTPHLTIRTSFIGLPDAGGRGLLSWAKRHKCIIGYDKVFWNGLTVNELSRIIFEVLIPNKVTGLVHLYGERVSKYDILDKARRVFNWDTEVLQESRIENLDVKHSGDRTLSSLYPEYQTNKTLDQMLQEMLNQNG